MELTKTTNADKVCGARLQRLRFASRDPAGEWLTLEIATSHPIAGPAPAWCALVSE
jgi:hypothetical protein